MGNRAKSLFCSVLFGFVQRISVHRRFTANNSPQGDSPETIHRRGDSPQANSPERRFTEGRFTAGLFTANSSPQKKVAARAIHRKVDLPQLTAGRFTAGQFTGGRFTANNSPQKKITARTIHRKDDSPQINSLEVDSPQTIHRKKKLQLGRFTARIIRRKQLTARRFTAGQSTGGRFTAGQFTGGAIHRKKNY
jgi:hypothetical protein